jgi:hypothetical protein
LRHGLSEDPSLPLHGFLEADETFMVASQHGFFAGDARSAVLPAATGAELGAFLKANVAANSHLLTGLPAIAAVTPISQSISRTRR